jgi:hypothetical protein
LIFHLLHMWTFQRHQPHANQQTTTQAAWISMQEPMLAHLRISCKLL